MSSMPFKHIVALGSSFASGPDIEPIIDKEANRSANNYAHLLAEKLGAELTDVTVSGATTDTIIDTPQRLLTTTYPPQLDSLPADADLVTITAGGNDLEYAGSMIKLGSAGRLSTDPHTRPLASQLARGGVPQPTSDDIDRAATNLVRIVDAVRDRAPNAHVLLVGYLAVMGPDTCYSHEVPLDDATVDAFRNLGDQVDEVFTRAATTSGADLVPMHEFSRDHALGSSEPWVRGLPKQLREIYRLMPFHPNDAGMRAVANTVYDYLQTN
ncbi:SGNH/GDSL hydrolase family protein [Nocardia sp. NPDC049149]|uniref:SGNH/GDSL hydrolase family protein n=1 Tax=Nocardia sp. NPDC049149 TaxID=3364315 RepID=UPI003720D739